MLDFLKEPLSARTDDYAYGLVAAYAIVYLGLAISYGWYEHNTYRILTIFRGSLVALIYEKTLHTSAYAVTNGKAVTLMSADIDRIGLGLREIHEW